MKKLMIGTVAALSLTVTVASSGVAQPAPPPNLANLDINAVSDLDRSSVARLQAALNQRGFDPGGIDGVAGPRTREAVRAFQDRYGMKATGVINNQMLFALGQAELAR